MKLPLPHDNWADLRDPDEIPRKAARAFRKVLYKVAAPSAGVDQNDPDAAAKVAAEMLGSADGMDGIEEMAEAMVLAVVADWSFGDVSPEVLDTVPDAAVNAIYDECQKQDYIAKLMPDFSTSPDEDSPTTPSSR